MIPIFSLYREAKNNPSQYYKFLCFFKIYEGINPLRASVIRRVKKKHITINIQKAIVPNHDAIKENHKQFIGKSIHNLFDNYFRKEFRIAIAHFTKNIEKPFNVSDYKTVKNIADNVILIDICCRELIKLQMELFKQISTNN